MEPPDDGTKVLALPDFPPMDSNAALIMDRGVSSSSPSTLRALLIAAVSPNKPDRVDFLPTSTMVLSERPASATSPASKMRLVAGRSVADLVREAVDEKDACRLPKNDACRWLAMAPVAGTAPVVTKPVPEEKVVPKVDAEHVQLLDRTAQATARNALVVRTGVLADRERQKDMCWLWRVRI